MKLSARNQLKGKIVDVKKGTTTAHVRIDISGTVITAAITSNFVESVVDIGRVDGTLYGLLFKAANKSTVWYNVTAFSDAGVEPPATWEDLTAAAGTLSASGVPASS